MLDAWSLASSTYYLYYKKSFLSMEFEKRMIQALQKQGSTVVSIRLSLTLRWSHKAAYAKLMKAPQGNALVLSPNSVTQSHEYV